MSIPTNSGDGKPIELSAGQSVMVIKTQKGMYLRLTDGKIVAIRVPAGNDSYGLPLNQGSVTIVPTMVHPGRGGIVGRGGVMIGRGGQMMRGVGVRRGRPPMGTQYALGQVVNKGQTAVRIVRRPIVNSKGKTTYQTIAVPVSSTAQGALLNKSVVITQATHGTAVQTNKQASKSQAPQVTLTPVLPKNSSLSITPVASTSGAKLSAAQQAKMIRDPKKLVRTNQMIIKSKVNPEKQNKEGKTILPEKNTDKSKDEKAINHKPEPEKDLTTKRFDQFSQPERNNPSDQSSDKTNITTAAATKTSATKDSLSTSFSEMSTSDTSNSKKNCANEGNVSTSTVGSSCQQMSNNLTDQTLANVPNSGDNYANNPIVANNSMNLHRQQPDLALAPQNVAQDLTNLSSLSGNTSVQDLSMSSQSDRHSNHNHHNQQQHHHSQHHHSVSNSSSSGHHKHSSKSSSMSSSEPLMGIVKPHIHDSKMSSSLSSLQSMSSLLPSESSLSSASSSDYPMTSYASSITSSSSQPLFQPFLHSSSSSSGASNVAQVAPHVQVPVYSSNSSVYQNPVGPTIASASINSASISTSSSSSSSLTSANLPSMQSAGHSSSGTSSGLNFSGVDVSQLSRSSDAALSLSSLLSQYDTSSAEDLISTAAHSSALDYLNYSLSAGSSAFRRPETLTSELQSLLTPASPAPSSSVPTAQSPAPFPAHQSTYSSQYPASAYRSSQFSRTSSSVNTYNAAAAAAYASQYSHYSSQYPSLAAAAAHASPSSSQAAATAAAAAAAAAAASQYPGSNPYQAFSATATPGLPPYSTGLGGFGHGPYPPPM